MLKISRINIFILLFQDTTEDDMGAKEPVSSVMSVSDGVTNKACDEIIDLNTSKIDESITDFDDSMISISSDTDIPCNDTSVNSISDPGQVENTTPTSKKLTSKTKTKKQESAKKVEEREKIKQVTYTQYIYKLFPSHEIVF